jgi:hypothetical protein
LSECSIKIIAKCDIGGLESPAKSLKKALYDGRGLRHGPCCIS